MKRLAIVLLILAAPSIADADCGYQSYGYQSYGYGQSYYTPPYVATFLGIPLYSITFTAPVVSTVTPTPPAQQASKTVADPKPQGECKDVAELKARIAALEKLLAQQTRTVAAPAGDVIKVFAAKCGACHEKAVAAEKGHGFVMLDAGKLAPLDDKAVNAIVRKTYVGAMPPKKSGLLLADEDRQAIESWVDSLQQAAK